MPFFMSAEPWLAPPLLRTPMMGRLPSQKKASHAVLHASGVFESCVAP